ncbi:holin-associated N-acetylmuramidase [Pseudooceanicola onchidii]|uniref:holin-associated N-acetylmuramidase n=1 Tax=Pseudooceanicola onchidii TaxID=2562279 RepID=UPI0010AAEAD8|nr:holin-associated N-acetylmuramidase [Pseudooceanicola onchidii]
MQKIRQMAQAIVAREGGYVDDPDDPGGATNFGVTIGTMRQLGLDLTGDGQITAQDVRALTRDRAAQIFVDRYFHAPGIDQLPEMLWDSVFDMQVNAGANAVKILQGLLNRMGARLTTDGVIGPQTVAAAQDAARRAPDHLTDAYGIARRNYYFALADRRPASRKFARTRAGGKGGWITRAEAFIAPRYHLTEQEFRKRTASWD